MPTRILPFLLMLLATGTYAQVLVNSASPITNRVFINVIRFATTTGLEATAWGTPEQEDYIKEQIDRILNQAGIDVEYSPPITVVSDFAYDGYPNNYSSTRRPTDDLMLIRDLVETPNFSDREVINLYLVEVVPGFARQGEYAANGRAFIDANGVAMHIGSELPTFKTGQEAIAALLAHEICHNLGLSHPSKSSDNLMQPGSLNGYLTSSQVDLIFTDRAGIDGYDFAKPLAETNFEAYLAASDAQGGETGDADGDGMANLLEFAIGTDPKFPDKQRLNASENASGSSPTLEFRKQASAVEDGVEYVFESSTNLTHWEPVTGTSILANSDSRFASELEATGSLQFRRLRIQRTSQSDETASMQANSITVHGADDFQAEPEISDCDHMITVFPE